MGIFNWLKQKQDNTPAIDNDLRRFGNFPKKYENRKIQVCLSDETKTRFNFNEIVCAMYSSDGKKYERYLLAGNNQQKAKIDILSLNYLVDDARVKVPSFRWKNLNPNNSLFVPTPMKDEDALSEYVFEPYYCHIDFEDMTPSGKFPKYPYRIIYHQYCDSKITMDSDFISANFEYLQNGHIGKLWFSQFIKKKHFTVACSMDKDDLLKIQKIESEDKNNNRVTIYTRPK